MLTIALIAAVAALAIGLVGVVLLMTRARVSAPSRASDRLASFLADIAGSLDIDHLLKRTLEAASELPGVDAGVLTVESVEHGTPLITSFGLSAEEAERRAVAGPPDGGHARSISIAYRYAPDEASDDNAIRNGVAVPLLADERTLGYLAVFTRDPGRSFGDDDVGELEALAGYAGPALENARRYREARQLADLDALTQLHNRRYFHETLTREVARGQRYKRPVALIVLDLDDFKAVNDRIGHLAGDAVLADVAERVREVVRTSDVACRVGGDEFAVILPESTVADAEGLYARLERAVSARPVARAGSVSFSAGMTDLRPGDDTRTFFERADEALYRAKGAGKGQVVAAAG